MICVTAKCALTQVAENKNALHDLYGPAIKYAWRGNKQDGMWQDPLQYATAMVRVQVHMYSGHSYCVQ